MTFYVGQKRRFVRAFKRYPKGAIVTVIEIDEKGDPRIDGSEYGEIENDWYFSDDLADLTEGVIA